MVHHTYPYEKFFFVTSNNDSFFQMIYSMLGTLMLLLLQPVLSQQPVPDKYTDENRPYKFGFNIDGYQHRNEEKSKDFYWLLYI